MQDLHRTLWSSYLGLRDADEFQRAKAKERPQTLDEIVATLTREGGRLAPPLLKLAVWNLVSRYGEGEHPRALEELSRRTLDHDVAEARRVVQERGPTLLHQVAPGKIEDSDWKSQEDGLVSSAKLSLAVNRGLDDVRYLLQPKHWEDVSPFWTEVRLGRPKLTPQTRSWRGRASTMLVLPGGTQRPSRRLRLELDITRTPFESRVDLALAPARRGGRGQRGERARGQDGGVVSELKAYLRLHKEEGRPGITRLERWQMVGFQPGSLHQRFRSQTLEYWITVETLALMLGFWCSGQGGRSSRNRGRRSKRGRHPRPCPRPLPWTTPTLPPRASGPRSGARTSDASTVIQGWFHAPTPRSPSTTAAWSFGTSARSTSG